jgi:NADH:ubiquinone oxidoreductase subunit 2 (subunit N)
VCPAAGFPGKFLIRAALESRLLWLPIIGVATTSVAFYYYLYVIVQMYMREPNEIQDVTLAEYETPACFRLQHSI